jgi:hypothetical protein
MKSLLTYLRQIFFGDTGLILFITSTLVTVFCWTIGIFYWGLDLLLLPVMMGIFFIAVSGPVVVIIYLIRKNRDGQGLKNLGRLKSLAFGAYLGLILLNPVDNWDEEQRQKSGLIVSESLERYKGQKGNYPKDLAEIKSELSNLPTTYPWDKFHYHVKEDNTYDLDILIPIMDRWHWDKDKNKFLYDDW